MLVVVKKPGNPEQKPGKPEQMRQIANTEKIICPYCQQKNNTG